MSPKLEAASPRCVQQTHLSSLDHAANCHNKNTPHKAARHQQKRVVIDSITISASPRKKGSTADANAVAPASTFPLNSPLLSSSSSPSLSSPLQSSPPSPTSKLASGTGAAVASETHLPAATDMTITTASNSANYGDVGDKTLWIRALLTTKFYGVCPKHPNLRKNDLNLFCTQHSVKICQYCHSLNKASSSCNAESISSSLNCNSQCHSKCTVLHVSRYMYHDVLLAREASLLLDLAHVQSYLNNGNRVVYIDRRAQPRSKLAPNAKACAVCDRTLQEPYKFCSIFCRLAFDKHPAAVATLPLPDGAPLPGSNIRKATNSSFNSDVAIGKSERHQERERNKYSVSDGEDNDQKRTVPHLEAREDRSIGRCSNEDVTRSCDENTDKSNGHRKRSSESVHSNETVGRQTSMCEGRTTKRGRKRRPVPSLVQVDNALILTL